MTTRAMIATAFVLACLATGATIAHGLYTHNTDESGGAVLGGALVLWFLMSCNQDLES